MTDREKLLAEAVAVGLILGADFEKNISNVNLQKKIEEKKAENEANVKENQEQLLDGFDSDEERLDTALKALEDGNLKEEDLSDYDKELLAKHRQKIDESLGIPTDLLGKEVEGNAATNLQKKIEESQEEVEEEKVVILRTSKCGAYKLKFVNGYEHCAAKNQISVEQLKEAIEAGKELNGFTYKLK